MANRHARGAGTAIMAFRVDGLSPLPPGRIGLLCPCLDGLPPQRAAETGLLPIHDANGELLHALEAAGGLPPGYYAGVLAIDPFRRLPSLLERLRAAGVSGVANFPTTGVVDGTMRSTLEELGMSFEQEVQFLRHARDMGMRSAGVVASVDQARRLAEAGIDTFIALATATLDRAAIEDELLGAGSVFYLSSRSTAKR